MNPSARLGFAGLTALVLSGCTMTAGPVPGTPEFTAAQVSRAYDCGLKVDRNRIIAHLPPEDRRRFLAANAGFAVKSYKAPRRCEDTERARVQRELPLLGRR